MKNKYGIVANVTSLDRVLKLGSKAWLVGYTTGNEGCTYQWLGRSRSGRLVTKWTATKKFSNFRSAWIPEHIRKTNDGHIHFSGSKKEMVEVAEGFNDKANSFRQKHQK